MGKRMVQNARYLLIIILLLSTAGKSFAGAATGGATEVTQLLNNVELLLGNVTEASELAKQTEQLAHEVQMINNQIQNLKNLPTSAMATVNSLTSLSNAIKTGYIISYAAANLDSQYAAKYKGYSDYSSMGLTSSIIQSKYNAWSQGSRDNIVATLKAAQIQENTIMNEETRLNAIKAKSQSAVGNLQALQAGNLIAAEEVSSLQRLRKLLMDQAQFQANFQAIQADKDALSEARWRSITNTSLSTNTGDGTSINTLP